MGAIDPQGMFLERGYCLIRDLLGSTWNKLPVGWLVRAYQWRALANSRRQPGYVTKVFEDI